MTETPTKAPCWEDDPDWLDGPTEIELPSEKYLKAEWDADILDIDDKSVHDTIIQGEDTFKVRFRVQLKGRLWRCVCGDWCFDVGFTAIGEGEHFDLSDKLPAEEKEKLRISDWEGCDSLCVSRTVTVPPGTIPVGDCGTMYEVGAKFELRCCGDCDDPDSHLAVAGHERLGQYMFD